MSRCMLRHAGRCMVLMAFSGSLTILGIVFAFIGITLLAFADIESNKTDKHPEHTMD